MLSCFVSDYALPVKTPKTGPPNSLQPYTNMCTADVQLLFAPRQESIAIA